MKKYLFALLISLAGIGLSYQFLRPDIWTHEGETIKEPIAKLANAKAGVKKKSAGKVIWVDIKNGDELYKGDIVQTSQSSTATIDFINSDSKINIDPGTTIIVQQAKGDVTLDVLSGSFFVESNNKNSNLKIKAGGKEVAVGNSQAAFSVDKAGGLSAEVFKGELAGAKGIDIKKDVFLDLYPSYGQTIYQDPSEKEVTFKWKKLKERMDVELYVGATKKTLAKVDPEKIIKDPSLNKGGFEQLIANLDSGTYFWQLKGLDNSNKEVASKVYQLNLKTKLPPKTVYPANLEEVSFLRGDKQQILLRWLNRSPSDKAVVQISADPAFSTIIWEKQTKKTAIKYDHTSNVGKFFWRVKSFLKGSTQSVFTPVSEFEVKIFDKIFPPKPLSPRADDKFIIAENKKNIDVDLIWDRIKKASKYHVLVKKVSGGKFFQFDQMVETPQVKLPKLAPGKYTWQLASLDKSGKESNMSPALTFTVARPSLIKWGNFDPEFYYLTDTDAMKIDWEKRKNEDNWQLFVSKEQNMQNAKTFNTETNFWKFRSKNDGVYYFQVKAVNANGQVIGKTSVKEILYQMRPLPKAPRYSKSLSSIFKASASGKFNIVFEKAERPDDVYQVQIKNLAGQIIRQVRLTQPSKVITGLMPGRYFVDAKIQDKYGRSGPASESRELVVPKQSKVAAPKIENIIIR